MPHKVVATQRPLPKCLYAPKLLTRNDKALLDAWLHPEHPFILHSVVPVWSTPMIKRGRIQPTSSYDLKELIACYTVECFLRHRFRQPVLWVTIHQPDHLDRVSHGHISPRLVLDLGTGELYLQKKRVVVAQLPKSTISTMLSQISTPFQTAFLPR